MALVDAKGGVGKSTLAVHLASDAAQRGRRVVFINADPNASGSRFLREVLADRIGIERAETTDDLLELVPRVAAAASLS